ncbi:MAG: beta-phosphoglucomutase family hydrolase [Chloroflexota bacterium]
MTASDIRGIIFDVDGLIADTDALHFQTWQRLADEVGVPFSYEKYLLMSGAGHERNARLFTEGLDVPADTVQEWMDRKQAYYVELRKTLQPSDAMPGVRSLIEEVAESDLKMGVGSSSRNAKPVLKRLDLFDYFTVIADGYTVKNLKPAPDIFVWVAGGLGLKPEQCLVLEDAVAGVDAARAGGFSVIGVGSAPFVEADATLPSLENVSLSDLLALID